MIPLKELKATILNNPHYASLSIYNLVILGLKHTDINGVGIDDQDNKVWYKDGRVHREDGPAIEWRSGYKAWYLKGTFIRDKKGKHGKY